MGSKDTSYTIASTLRDRYSSAYANTLTIAPETGIDPVGHIYICGIGMILQQYQQQNNPTLASLQACEYIQVMAITASLGDNLIELLPTSLATSMEQESRPQFSIIWYSLSSQIIRMLL